MYLKISLVLNNISHRIVMQSFSLKFISAIFAAITIFAPQQVYAQTTLSEIGETSNSVFRTVDSGGVIIRIDSKLKLEPTMLSYRGEHLYAVIDGKQLEVRISPKLILEALEILKKTNRTTFQISINPTTTKQVAYIDFPLRDTEIGQAFLKADEGGLSDLLTRSVELPWGAPSHPDDIAKQLLETDTDYQSLPIKVGIPSSILIGSQTYLSFNPSAPGLVDIRFKPLIAFLSVRGQYLAVDERIQTFVERPYRPFAEDIKSRPLEYRKTLPSLEKASAITAAMGLINAGCRTAGSCTHLLRQSRIAHLTQSLKQVHREPSPSLSRSSDILERHWRNFSSVTWKPGNNSKAWSSSYNALCQILANPSNEKTTSTAKYLISQQFQQYSVPDDSILQAASAVVYAWKGNVNAAEQSLQRAIKLSEKSVEDRFEAANIGLHVSRILRAAGDEEKADEIYFIMKFIRDEAQVAAFDKFDKLLQTCELESTSCSLNHLLIWESEAFRAGLFGSIHLWLLKSEWFISDLGWEIPGRNVAWLHGRFAYLIGMRLDDPTERLNRLRYLESYADDSSLSLSNSIHLKILLYHLRASLELGSESTKK